MRFSINIVGGKKTNISFSLRDLQQNYLSSLIKVCLNAECQLREKLLQNVTRV